MSNGELAPNRRDQVCEVRTMLNVREKRFVLFVDRLPVGAVHLRVIEKLALNSPSLLKNLRPLGSWIDKRLELPNVQRAVPDLSWAVNWNNSPAVAGTLGLVHELLVVSRKRVGANSFEKRCSGSLLELILLQSQPGHAGHSLQIEHYSGTTGRKTAVVSRRYSQCEDPLADAVEVNSNRGRPARRFGFGLGSRLIAARLVSGLGQERRRIGRAQHSNVDRSANGTVKRAHLQPAASRTVVGAGHEIQVLAAGVERGRDRVRHAI